MNSDHPSMRAYSVQVIACLLALASAGSAVESAPPLARQVHELFERRCAECHDQAGHNASKGKFGIVLDLAKLRADPDYVNLTAPQASVIYQRLIDADAESRMPKLSKAEKARGDLKEPVPLKADEIALVLKWLESNAPTLGDNPTGGVAAEAAKPPAEPEKPASSIPSLPTAVAQRTVVLEADAMVDLQRDLFKQPEQDRPQVRYISLLPQYNNSVEVGDAELDVARSGVRKLLNSLSTNPKVAVFEEVGPGKAFFRFKLDDLGWDAALWERIASFYPYALQDSNLGRAAHTEVPVLRADWLATNGARPPLYYEILRLPATLDELSHKLGVDVAANLRAGKALRAGFTTSGISRFNRLIERHDVGTHQGAYWLSYDFAGSGEQRDLITNPLGPASAGLADGRRAFAHDGGEMIFNLPNGFQGYYLSNSKGARLDIAPTSIVGDLNGVTGRPDVVNGLSCIICHIGGTKEQPGSKEMVTDQVRALAGRGQFTAAQEEAILALFPEQKKITAALTEDRAFFKAALTKAGVVQGATEPVSTLTLPFEEHLTFARAASELGLSAKDLEDKLKERDDFGILRVGLGQRALPRDVFGTDFANLARRLNIGTVRDSAILQGTVDVLRAQEEKKRPRPLLFELRTDKRSYRSGQPVIIAVHAEKEGHLRLFYKDAAGDVTTLFPTEQVARQALAVKRTLNDVIPGGRPVIVSGEGSVTNITVVIEGPKFGPEQLGAVLTDFPLEDDAELRAEIAKSRSIELAVSATARVAAKSARARVNTTGGTEAPPRLGVQIVHLFTTAK